MLLTGFVSFGWASSASADFGISQFNVTARNADGTIDGVAASHPFSLLVHFAMNTDGKGEPEGVLNRVRVDLPSGLSGNALAVPRCSTAEFEATTEPGGSSPRCSGATQVGVFQGRRAPFGELNAPIYNLAPTAGSAAAFGIMINGETFVQRLSVIGTGDGGSVRLSGTLPGGSRIVDASEELWGVPADPDHDAERVCLTPEGNTVQGCSAEVEESPLLTLPASCLNPMRTTVTATSVGPPAVSSVATSVSSDAGGNPQSLIECERVPFAPRFSMQTEAAALSPTGLSLELEVPQHEDIDLTPSAALANVGIELPEGFSLNPPAGERLSGCPPLAIGLETAPGAQPPAFNESAASCPAASRLGGVTLGSPLIDHELSGSVFLATPSANPFGSRYAIYLVVEDKATGTLLKVPARLDADPATGRLAVAMPELPPLPFEDLELQFAAGPRALFAGPPACGRYAAKATFEPSTAPFGFPATSRVAVVVASGAAGQPCPPPESQRPASPSFQAGTESAAAGRNSPLLVGLSRDDGDQQFGRFELTLPPGLIANLGSVPIGAAVGSVQVGAGLGSQPLALNGTAYLGGPYKGSPYSLEIVVPAKVGPFDLGTIVQRAAVSVDPATAQLRVSSDPLPQILGGVPLQLRSFRLDLDRPGFVRNPTSCEQMAITGSATTSIGQSTPLSARFQVGNCAKLSFKPKLSLGLSGALSRNGHPNVRAVLRADPGGAALAGLGFTLPADELLDLRQLRGLCPRGAAAARCPRDSRLGKLRLESPFADGVLEGPIYLREPSRGLPDLIAELRSGGLRFVLHGRTATSHGRLALSFGSLPDIPLSKAVLSLAGGRRGIVVNSRSLCSGIGAATATATAHNGMRRDLRIRPNLGREC